jgi:hypothetical protein
MSIANYSELKSAIQNWIARSDDAFNLRMDDFIALAEDRIHYGSGEPGEASYTAPLRIRQMETSGDLTVSSQAVSLPTGFLQERRIYLNTDPKTDLKYLPPDRFWATSGNASGTSGKPVSYTIEGTDLVFGPSPDSSYTGKILYYKKLDALSASAATNWLILNSPGTYLYACLMEAALWDRNDEDAIKYQGLYHARVNALMRQSSLSMYGGGALTSRVDRVA